MASSRDPAPVGQPLPGEPPSSRGTFSGPVRASRAGALAALVGAVVLLSGCGSPAAHPAGSSTATGSSTSAADDGAPHSGTPAAAAYSASSTEADRVLALTRVPPGSARNDELAQSPPSTPGASHVTRTAAWSVPLGFSQAVIWLQSHPPQDIAQSGLFTGPTGGSEPASRGITYSAAPATSWQSADLSIMATAAKGGRTTFEAYSQVVWLDPTPYPDVAKGRRVHLSAMQGCPPRLSGYVGVRNTGAGPRTTLVPAGAPRRALVCAYSSADATPSSHLLYQRAYGAHNATLLAAGLRAVPLTHPDGAVTSCPMDSGAVTVVSLRYAGGSDLDIWYARTGCPTLANGAIRAAAQGLPKAAATLLANGTSTIGLPSPHPRATPKPTTHPKPKPTRHPAPTKRATSTKHRH